MCDCVYFSLLPKIKNKNAERCSHDGFFFFKSPSHMCIFLSTFIIKRQSFIITLHYVTLWSSLLLMAGAL